MLENTSMLKSKLERLHLTDSRPDQIKSGGVIDGLPCVVKVVAQEFIVDMTPTRPDRENARASSQSQPSMMP